MSRPDESLDPAAAGCQLLLISPPQLDPARFALDLDAALAVGGLAGFLLRLDPEDGSLARDAAAGLRPVCARRGVAFLVQGDVRLAQALGADGVHLADPRAVRAARAALGAERILGVSCGTSRDAAMVAGDDGADYVAFGDPGRPPGPEVMELLRWWSELFVLPCLAEVATTIDAGAPLARAGADFVAASEVIWAHPDGAGAAVRALQRALDQG